MKLNYAAVFVPVEPLNKISSQNYLIVIAQVKHNLLQPTVESNGVLAHFEFTCVLKCLGLSWWPSRNIEAVKAMGCRAVFGLWASQGWFSFSIAEWGEAAYFPFQHRSLANYSTTMNFHCSFCRKANIIKVADRKRKWTQWEKGLRITCIQKTLDCLHWI